MKSLVFAALLIVFGTQLSFAKEVSNSHESDSKPVRIIREIR